MAEDTLLSSPLEFKIAVFGERRVKIFKLCIDVEFRFQDHPEEFIRLTLLQSLPKFSHWVLDVCFLKVISTFSVSIRSRLRALYICGL